MKKKRTFSLILAAILIITTLVPLATFAAQAPDDTVDPQTILTITKSFIADSNTRATARVSASSGGFTPFITSKITLQSTSLGGSNYTNVSSVDPDIYTVDTVSILHICTFPITTTKDYRIKIELTDKVNGVEVTKTYYQNLTR